MIALIRLGATAAAGFVPSGGCKMSTRRLSIVQFIFHLWFFKIRGNTLRNQKKILVLNHILARFLLFGLIGIYIRS